MSRFARLLRFLRLGLALSLLAVSVSKATADLPKLPALNIDPKETSISGISSGAFMAGQFAIAHSSTIKGVGIIAGGPYYCAKGSSVAGMTLCSCTGEPILPCAVTNNSADVPHLITDTHDFYDKPQRWAPEERDPQPLIDNPDNIAHQRIIALAGEQDEKVPTEIAAQLDAYYRGMGATPNNFQLKPLPGTAHTLPTMNYGGDCGVSDHPYIGRCGFDSAKAILSWIYNDRPLQPARPPQETNFRHFDQAAYIPKDDPTFTWMTGLDNSGWIYVPKQCARGEPCRLHIVLHGCRQGEHFDVLGPEGDYGTRFVKHSGYADWADNNNLVILFPQADTVPLLNINGCWDWFGYTGKHYANQRGLQIRTLKAMVDRLTSGYSQGARVRQATRQ